MKETTWRFSEKEIQEFGLPNNPTEKVVWSHYDYDSGFIYFRLKGMREDLAWKGNVKYFLYSLSVDKCLSKSNPIYLECKLVRKVEKTITMWETVEENQL